MQRLLHVAVVVQDYDEAISWYTEKLGFQLIDDTYQPEQDKRWVLIAPAGSSKGRDAMILLARASNDEQKKFIGNQTGGRVFLFLRTDDFWRDYNTYLENGVKFIRSPTQHNYGIVAVFSDLYGNLWDLIELSD